MAVAWGHDSLPTAGPIPAPLFRLAALAAGLFSFPCLVPLFPRRKVSIPEVDLIDLPDAGTVDWDALGFGRSSNGKRIPQEEDALIPRGSGEAREGSAWHSRASVRLAAVPESSEPEKQKTLAKPDVSGAQRGSSVERLRSESNRRWRICNQKSKPVSPGVEAVSEEVTTKATTPEPADPALARVVEAWSSLPPAVRAGILAMVEASR